MSITTCNSEPLPHLKHCILWLNEAEIQAACSPESKYLGLGQAFKFSLFAITEYALYK